MKNEQIIKIAMKIARNDVRVCQKACFDNDYPIDYLKVNGVEFDLDNEDYWIYIVVFVKATAYRYQEPDDFYTPGYIDYKYYDDEISDDSYIEISFGEISSSDESKIIEFNENDKIEIKFDNKTFKNNYGNIVDEILEKYYEKVKIDDDDWEVDYDWYHD